MNNENNSSDAPILCTLCDMDITALEALERNAHVEECLDNGRVAFRQVEASSSVDLTTATLDRLNDCPVCGATWPLTDPLRVKHVKGCAAEHGLSAKELVSLIEMFRESLDNSSRSSAADVKTSSERSSALVESHNSDNSCSSNSFQQAIDQRPRKAKANTATTITVDGGKTRSIDSWFGNRKSEKSAQPASNDKALPINSSTYNGTVRRSQDSRNSISFDIEEDDDFKSTRVRIPLRQTILSARRVGKKRQEVLDEMDDDLNEAKALSLSLRHGPDPELSKHRKSNSRRKEARSKAAELLNRSDILASKEAQSYIRQRAVALRYMDERRETTAKNVEESANDDLIRATSPPITGSELWRMGSLDRMPDRSYCSIFENYKVG
ncbi:5'-flap endonuclease [Coemansia guatemalensis]|uniref:5'-flap endonuclease n=1 Tax=Coemansia guatemalensis TaxID=2761395 RepID=A0A9W8I212_9FUNG|nr:5'-flap endonuclease [Coemansia guatemalensis]